MLKQETVNQLLIDEPRPAVVCVSVVSFCDVVMMILMVDLVGCRCGRCVRVGGVAIAVTVRSQGVHWCRVNSVLSTDSFY